MASPATLDPLFHATAKFRRRDFDACISLCDDLLAVNPRDQAVWFLKCRALTEKAYIDDTDMEEEGVGEVLLDDNATAQAPRPGTSLSRPATTRPGGGGLDGAMRPMTQSGRPVTGFARPGTSSRPTTGAVSVDQAFRGVRPGTSRPMTALGRQVRLGTASMMAQAGGGGPFINVERLDLKRYAARPAIAKALIDYILHVDHNPRRGLELAAAATVAAGYLDWWWKQRLGKCYYQLGLLRDAEKQFRSALRQQDMLSTSLELAKVYLRLDQPGAAQDVYTRCSESFPGDTHVLLGAARVWESLNEGDKAVALYKRVLQFDASSVEALACLAANHFYSDQPEVALKYYRRLLQMGVQTTELWSNLGLCTFYAGQYDMTLSCFDRALGLADDNSMAEVWYNIGHVAIGIGDVGLAYQAFRVAVNVDSTHAESFNNLGVLEMRKNNLEAARNNFGTAQKLADLAFEPFYNGALMCYKLGDFQEAHSLLAKAIKNFPDHGDSQELLKTLIQHLTAL